MQVTDDSKTDANLYYRYVLDAISRGAVKELRQIWKNSLDMGSTGSVLRTLITNKLPEVALIRKFTIEENTTFQDFLKLYKTKKIRNRCERGPQHCLVYYSRKQNMEGIKYALSHYKHWEDNDYIREVEKIVGANAPLDFVLAFEAEIAKVNGGMKYPVYLFQGAIRGENLEVIDYYLKPENNNYLGDSYEYGISGAAEGEHVGWIYFFLEKGTTLYDDDLQLAAKTGNRKILNLVLSKFPNANPAFGLVGAVEGENMELIEYFMQLGANKAKDMNRALVTAAGTGNLKLVEFFLNKGASDFYPAIREAADEGQLAMVQFLYSKLGEKLNKRGLEDALAAATYNEHWTTAKFLLDKGVDASDVEEKEIEKVKRFG